MKFEGSKAYWLPAFSPFPTIFSKGFYPRLFKSLDCMVKGKTLLFSMGNIVIELYWKHAPNTCRNFAELVRRGYYNGVKFHRIIKDFMIQGGDPTATGRAEYQFLYYYMYLLTKKKKKTTL